jgi:hypothetical protein
MNERMRRFVSWASANISRLEKKSDDEAAEDLYTALSDVDERLGVEVSTADDTQEREVIITAFSVQSLFPLVKRLVDLFPSIPGWKIIALKPPRGFEFKLTVGEHELNAEELEFQPMPDINGSVQLLVPSKLFEMLPAGEERVEFAWLILESGIGEELCSNIEELDFAVAEFAKNKRPIRELWSCLGGK